MCCAALQEAPTSDHRVGRSSFDGQEIRPACLAAYFFSIHLLTFSSFHCHVLPSRPRIRIFSMKSQVVLSPPEMAWAPQLLPTLEIAGNNDVRPKSTPRSIHQQTTDSQIDQHTYISRFSVGSSGGLYSVSSCCSPLYALFHHTAKAVP